MTYLVTTFDAFTCRMPMVLELADRKLALNYLANQILNLSSRGRITTLKKNESNKACFFADGSWVKMTSYKTLRDKPTF